MTYRLWTSKSIVCRKFDFFPKGTAGADGWMSLYFKFADQFSDNQQIGFGFKLHVINFQCPSQTLRKGMTVSGTILCKLHVVNCHYPSQTLTQGVAAINTHNQCTLFCNLSYMPLGRKQHFAVTVQYKSSMLNQDDLAMCPAIFSRRFRCWSASTD